MKSYKLKYSLIPGTFRVEFLSGNSMNEVVNTFVKRVGIRKEQVLNCCLIKN
jgi:hypothetical protein